jgi:hypothetical protein
MFRLGKILFLGTEAGTIQDPLGLVRQRPSVEEEKVMRTYLFAIISAAFFALPASAFSQDIEFGAGGAGRFRPWGGHDELKVVLNADASTNRHQGRKA